jgi:endonuclease YncB( thermonuclease family)
MATGTTVARTETNVSRHFKRPWPTGGGSRNGSPLRGPRRPVWALLGVLGVAIASWLANKPFGPSRYTTGSGEISGRATAIDGDSLKIGSNEFRLRGIDAPEGRQECQRNGRDWPCGREAAAALRELVSRGQVTCASKERDQHNRFLAVCRNADGDINARMVADGWATAYDRGNDALYQREEQAARGIWQGQFTPPREWRRQNGIGGR